MKEAAAGESASEDNPARFRTHSRVCRLRARGLSVPLDRPIRTASGDVTYAPLVLVDINTDTGITGSAYVFTYTPLVLKPACQLIEAIGQLLCGEPVAPLAAEGKLRQRFRLLGDTGLVGIAIAALDMALWDALAREAGLPLVRLLGGEPSPIAAYLSVGMDGLETARADARKAVEQGFRALKVKIGYPSLQEDLQVVQEVKAILGDSAGLMVDYNQSLTVPEALRRCQALDEFELIWIEEPTRQDDYIGHAKISAAIKTPVQLGENWYGAGEMAKAIRAGACDLVMPDLMKIGGVSGWLRASRIAEAASLPVSSHIFQEMTAHLMCVTPGAHWLEHMTKADPILIAPLRVENGTAHIVDEPGSGIAWNERAVESFLAT